MVSYSTSVAKLEEREELAFTLGKILAKLNENFYSERGIHFRIGKHGTWIEMEIKDEAWAKESVGTGGFEDFHEMQNDSLIVNNHKNGQQFSIPTDGLLKGTVRSESMSEFKSEYRSTENEV